MSFSQLANIWESTSERYGTTVPTLEFGGLSTGITYSAVAGQQKCYWYANGPIIQYSCLLVLTSKGTATGAARVKLNFPSYVAQAAGAVSLWCDNMTLNATDKHVQAQLIAGSSAIRLAEMGGAGPDIAVEWTDAQFTNTSYLTLDGKLFLNSITYP